MCHHIPHQICHLIPSAEFPSKTVELRTINKRISHGSYYYSSPNINMSWLCYIPTMGIISYKIYEITDLDVKDHPYTDPCLSLQFTLCASWLTFYTQ